MTEKPDFKAIRQQVSILAAAARLGVPVAAGNKLRCCNPSGHKQGDRNPSVSISAESGTFRCWVCPDVRGDVIDFVRHYGGMDWREAVSFLQGLGASGGAEVAPERLIAPRQQSVLEEGHVLAMEALLSLSSPLDFRCRTYLESRGIDPVVADSVGVRCLVSPVDVRARLVEQLGNAPGSGAVLNKEGNLRFHMHRLLFPYWNEEGRIVYIQGRDITGKAGAKENAAHCPITMPWIPTNLESETVVVTEGVIDGLTVLTHGWEVLGLPGSGTWLTWWRDFLYGKTVLLGLDGDVAGREATKKIAADLEGFAARVVDLEIPDEQDLNSLAKSDQLRPLLERQHAFSLQ